MQLACHIWKYNYNFYFIFKLQYIIIIFLKKSARFDYYACYIMDICVFGKKEPPGHLLPKLIRMTYYKNEMIYIQKRVSVLRCRFGNPNAATTDSYFT